MPDNGLNANTLSQRSIRAAESGREMLELICRLKNMKQLPLIVLSIIGLASFVGHAQVSNNRNEQSRVPIVDRKVSDQIDLSSARISSLFEKSLHSVKSSGGIVLLSEEGDEYHKFEPTSLSLRDVLDSVVKVEPRYLWTVENGVINLVPALDSPALLDVRIGEFKVDKFTVSASLEVLKTMPEVQKSLGISGLEEFTLSLCCGLMDPNPPPPKTVSIHLVKPTVKEVLNAIVREHGQAVWTYYDWQDWPEKGKKYFRLSISDN